MGRLRAMLSDSPDWETLLHTGKARDHLEAALRMCRKAQDILPESSARVATLHRLRGLERSIRGALQSLDGARKIGPLSEEAPVLPRPQSKPPAPIHKTA